jgi:hypothetical protein
MQHSHRAREVLTRELTVEESFHKFVGQSKTRVNFAIRFLNVCTDSVSSA